VRPVLKWEDNIKMDLKWTWCEDLEWIFLIQERTQSRELANSNGLSTYIKGEKCLD
jgi:hypothetical protein